MELVNYKNISPKNIIYVKIYNITQSSGFPRRIYDRRRKYKAGL